MAITLCKGSLGYVIDNVEVVTTLEVADAELATIRESEGKLVSSDSGKVIPFDENKTLAGVLSNYGLMGKCVSVAQKNTAITVVAFEDWTEDNISEVVYATTAGEFTLVAPAVESIPVGTILSITKTTADNEKVGIVRLSI